MVSRREAAGALARQAQAYAAITEAAFGRELPLRRHRCASGSTTEPPRWSRSRRRSAPPSIGPPRPPGSCRVESERADRAESESVVVARRAEEAEERAAEAIVRVAELEQERDLLLAELDAWRSAPAYRRHA